MSVNRDVNKNVLFTFFLIFYFPYQLKYVKEKSTSCYKNVIFLEFHEHTDNTDIGGNIEITVSSRKLTNFLGALSSFVVFCSVGDNKLFGQIFHVHMSVQNVMYWFTPNAHCTSNSTLFPAVFSYPSRLKNNSNRANSN